MSTELAARSPYQAVTSCYMPRRWSHCPMCGACLRQCAAPSLHWVSMSPFGLTQHSDSFWWGQKTLSQRRNWEVWCTKSTALAVLRHMWGRWADASISGWMSTDGQWSLVKQPPLHWQSMLGGYTIRWTGTASQSFGPPAPPASKTSLRVYPH